MREGVADVQDVPGLVVFDDLVEGGVGVGLVVEEEVLFYFGEGAGAEGVVLGEVRGVLDGYHAVEVLLPVEESLEGAFGGVEELVVDRAGYEDGDVGVGVVPREVQVGVGRGEIEGFYLGSVELGLLVGIRGRDPVVEDMVEVVGDGGQSAVGQDRSELAGVAVTPGFFFLGLLARVGGLGTYLPEDLLYELLVPFCIGT